MKIHELNENVSIREATKIDIKNIAEINVACWRSAYKDIIDKDFLAGITTHGFAEHCRERFLKKDTVLRVAETLDSRVIGFCTGGPKRGETSDYDAEIYSIYILDAYQARGIGKRLIHSVVSKLFEWKHASIIIWTLKYNPYRRFYKSLGGRFVRESKFELGGSEYETVGYGWKDIRELLKATANEK